MSRRENNRRRTGSEVRGEDGRYLPGNRTGGRPPGAPNKPQRPAREWLSAELDARRGQLLAALDAEPALLWRAWEWCYGRPPQALDVAMSSPGDDNAERIAATVARFMGGDGAASFERGDDGRVSRIVLKGQAGEVRGVVTDLEYGGRVYIGGDPYEDV